MQILISDAAEADFNAIIDYGISQGYANPVDYIQMLRARLLVLAAHPSIGRIGRVEETREWVLSDTPYIVIYELLADGNVGVINILHGAQAFP